MGGKSKELNGLVFGRLLITKDAGRNKHGARLWECQCSCGTIKVVPASGILSGKTKSCGCLHKERMTKHGLRGHPLYTLYHAMLNRCSIDNKDTYEYYAGRGIIICERWLNSLENFILDMYPSYKKGLRLDRVNNDGNYEPSNCRWVTAQQNSFNTRSNKNTTSKYKGVSWHKDVKKWSVQIQKDGKIKHLGYFENEKEGALKYNIAAKELFGEFAYLNLIEE